MIDPHFFCILRFREPRAEIGHQYITIVTGQRPFTHEFEKIFRFFTSCAVTILDRRNVEEGQSEFDGERASR